MKIFKLFFAALLLAVMCSNAFAQMQDHKSMKVVKTASIKVWGNCDLCKARIENAAKVDGVSKAEWNAETKELTLVYNPSIVQDIDIQKRIAVVGHDTEIFKADDKVYDKLPECCKYSRKK
ncbi:MAG: ATPase [Mariniphaga sp.]|nr:ATPase [Mariniphaga sp.]